MRRAYPSWMEIPARFRGRRILTLFLLAPALMMNACHFRSKAEKAVAKQQLIGWSPIGSWSGRGSVQTVDFDSGTGLFRIRWTTSNENPPGRGVFVVDADSAVSGRTIANAINAHGVGSGIAYIRDDPRTFYLDVQSSGVDWKMTVEEGAQGEAP